MPGETDKTIKETIDFVVEMMPYYPPSMRKIIDNKVSINYAQALPATPLYEYAREHKFIKPGIDAEEEYLLDISDKEAYSNDHLFGNFDSTIKALQWHSYEVQNLESNNDVTLLGSSPTTKYQIFKYKNHAYGIQFHIEIKGNTVSDWACVPEYESALLSLIHI